MGGDGGDEGNGHPLTVINSIYQVDDPALQFPINPLQFGTGGGGSSRDPPNHDGYFGGLGGGNQRVGETVNANATNPALGGNVGRVGDDGNTGEEIENGSLTNDGQVVYYGYYGGSGLYPGCGGGAGGVLYRRTADDLSESYQIDRSFRSGAGANGVIQICIKKSSKHKINFTLTHQGTTSNYYYWLFQYTEKLNYQVLKNLSNVNVVCVGAGGGGGSSGHGVSNGGGGGGLTYGATISNMHINNIVSFLCGRGGIGGEPGINNATIGNATVFENETTSEVISAGGGHPGSTTAAGNGSSTFSHAYIGTQIQIIHGARGGDQSAGSNSASFDLFPSEIDNVLTSLSIPHNFGGGGGGSKENGDDHNYTPGIGAISNLGGARGISGSTVAAGPGVPGLFGGGGGAGGFEEDGDRHFGGNGGNGIIAMWVNKSNVI
jgi:hypothetical protein